MRSDPVQLERRGAILIVTLNRPERRNAIDAAMASALAAAIDALDSEENLQAGILTGAAPGFSSGMDLKAFLAGENPWHPVRGFAGITQQPSEKPLIAAVEGFAVAGGLEVALSCDLLVAARDARFGLPEVRRSLVATGGALLRLPQRVPLNAVMELALTGDLIDGEEAYRLGFANRLSEPGEALGTALELAERMSANGPLALAATKRILVEAAGWTDDPWERQREIAAPVLASEDAKEGARAFAEKRPPRWTKT